VDLGIEKAMSTAGCIYTVGHSNVGMAEFLGLLGAHEITAVADVRSYPRSRRHPHFVREALAASLAAEGIDYQWSPGLGGRRKPSPGSPHLGWQVPAFRAYADYMDTEGFVSALEETLAWAGGRRAALLCAERLWWQCHRRLISDFLVARGRMVEHILTPARRESHRLTEFLRLDGDRLYYDHVLPLGN
jgi:uncharacterized protein (DUF488 family)